MSVTKALSTKGFSSFHCFQNVNQCPDNSVMVFIIYCLATLLLLWTHFTVFHPQWALSLFLCKHINQTVKLEPKEIEILFSIILYSVMSKTQSKGLKKREIQDPRVSPKCFPHWIVSFVSEVSENCLILSHPRDISIMRVLHFICVWYSLGRYTP